MRVIAFNGSPRPNGATATLLKKALEGAASRGAETELVHLNTIAMKGCQACFSCKVRGGPSYGRCTQKDGMTPLYVKIESSDAILLGSPIYFGSVSAQAKLFIDRLFVYLNYANHSSLFPRRIPAGLVFTLGVPPERLSAFSAGMSAPQRVFTLFFGSAETLVSTDTFHVADYSKIVADAMEPQVERKLKHQREVFPQDCRKAFEMGARFAGGR